MLSNFAITFNLRRCNEGALIRKIMRGIYTPLPPGGAVQVETVNPALKAPGSKRLKLKFDELHSGYAFNVNLRQYRLGSTARKWLSCCGSA